MGCLPAGFTEKKRDVGILVYEAAREMREEETQKEEQRKEETRIRQLMAAYGKEEHDQVNVEGHDEDGDGDDGDSKINNDDEEGDDDDDDGKKGGGKDSRDNNDGEEGDDDGDGRKGGGKDSRDKNDDEDDDNKNLETNRCYQKYGSPCSSSLRSGGGAE